jgi:hypothetical protein
MDGRFHGRTEHAQDQLGVIFSLVFFGGASSAQHGTAALSYQLSRSDNVGSMYIYVQKHEVQR